MEPKIAKDLDKWKCSDYRKPLIIYGARQVGKTYLALTFGKEKYKNTACFNMEDSSEPAAIFERDLNPKRIVAELVVKSGQTIFQEDTLIIFDEIEACERALTSLKYFCEQAPGYHIIAASSLLGVAVNREKYSFPVGKVEMLQLYPLDFEEFLWATGNTDMAKYATPRETTRIMAAWASIPGQLAKENRKFQYAGIKSGARAYEYEMPINWLKVAEVINQCGKVTAGHTPLSAYADSNFFKLYMIYTGLLCSKFDLPAAENVRSKSLNLFMEKYNPPYALRISDKNFGYENKIRSIPLYAVYCLNS